jgi:hypothetical protein
MPYARARQGFVLHRKPGLSGMAVVRRCLIIHGRSVQGTTMYLPDQTTRINADGLRYESKQPGSVFGPTAGMMSCFVCGTHRPRSFLRPFRIGAGTNYRCRGGCRE